MRKLIAITIGILSLTAASNAVLVDSAPATQGASDSVRITISEVTGNVQVRASEIEAWQKATVGAEVAEGAEFRTGPRSSVRCSIPPDQAFTLDRLGTVRVAQALWNGKKAKTDLMMKYGRTKLVVEGAGVEHESTISSPGGGLVVRGTVVSLYDQPPFVPEGMSYTGRAMFRDSQRRLSAFGGKGQGTTTVRADKDSAAETALAQGVVDPQLAAARTRSDSYYIANEVARGGIVSFDSLANIAVVRNSPPITNDRVLAQSLPLGLEFVLRWNGKADINLEVFRAAGDPLTLFSSGKGFNPTEFLYPGYGLNIVQSGGKIPFDHRGGPLGGTEIAYWPGKVPNGVYGVVGTFISGQPVTVQLDVFVDRVKQTIFTTDAQGNLGQTTNYTTKLSSGLTPGGPLVFIPALNFGAAQPAVATVTPARTTASVASKSTTVRPSGTVQNASNASPRPVNSTKRP